MRNKCVQMSLYDTYKCVAASMEDDKPKLFRQLDEHIDWDSLIPSRFYLAFYRNIGRPRKYPLVAFLKSLVPTRTGQSMVCSPTMPPPIQR